LCNRLITTLVPEDQNRRHESLLQWCLSVDRF
jgi:hypothetical protein